MTGEINSARRVAIARIGSVSLAMAALAQAVGAAAQGLGPLGMAIADAKRDPVFHDGSSYAVRHATRVRATGLTAIPPEVETRQIRRARERAEKKEAAHG